VALATIEEPDDSGVDIGSPFSKPGDRILGDRAVLASPLSARYSNMDVESEKHWNSAP
jgi:hypothetical protein